MEITIIYGTETGNSESLAREAKPSPRRQEVEERLRELEELLRDWP